MMSTMSNAKMTGINVLSRSTSCKGCPICGRKDLCMATPDLLTALCRRPIVKQTSPTRNDYREFPTKKEGMLFRHVSIAGDRLDTYRSIRPPVIKIEERPEPRPNYDYLAAAKRAYSKGDPSVLAEKLGVPEWTIVSLRVGRIVDEMQGGGRRTQEAWSIPLRNGNCDIIGFRLRYDTGEKRAFVGGKNGLIIPVDKLASNSDPLYVAEGESDCSALLACGFNVVAKPGRTAAVDHLITYLRERWLEVIIVGDRDKNNDGWLSAKATAKKVKESTGVKSMKAILPYYPYNDVREVYNALGRERCASMFKALPQNTEEF